MFGTAQTIASGAGADTFAIGAVPTLFIVQGSDTVYGGAGADTVVMQAGASALVAGATGPLDVFGGAGSATVVGGAGGGLFIGGSGGRNVLVGGNAASTLIGVGNGDALFGGTGNLLVSGSGEEIAALAAQDTLFTAAASGDVDLVVASGSVDAGALIGLGAGIASLGSLYQATVHGGAGAATVDGAALEVWGGSGSLVVSLSGAQYHAASDSTVAGGNGSLTVFGGGAANLLIGGLAGNNVLEAQSGSTLIGGGNGDQIVVSVPSGVGNDLIVAGPGQETISDAAMPLGLGVGANTIFGGTGQDSVTLYEIAEKFFGGSGSATVNMDFLSGGDTILGGAGRLTAFDNASMPSLVVGGNAGDNLLISTQASNTLFGAGNGDRLVDQSLFGSFLLAGAGNETLQADADPLGKPTLVAGTGNDLMITGGSGPISAMQNALFTVGAATTHPPTLFVFFAGHAGGADTIQGFAGNDTIVLSGYGKQAASQVLASQSDIGGNANLLLGDGTRIMIAGVAALAPGDVLSS